MSAVMDSGARRFDGDNRLFGYAVLCSIVLHGLLLLALPSLRDSSRRADAHPGPLVARLVPAQPTPAAPAPPKAEPPPAPRVEEKPPPAPVIKPAPARKPEPLAKAQKAPAKPAPVAPAAPAPAETPPAPAPSAAPPAPATARAESVPAAPAPPPPAAPEALDAGTLAQYRLQLISVAKRYKRYPRVAMDNNWEGTAEIRMIVGANGMIASLAVRKGSGYEVLDQEALQWIRKAKPLAPIPAALRGKEFTVDIPVIFNLKEPGA